MDGSWIDFDACPGLSGQQFGSLRRMQRSGQAHVTELTSHLLAFVPGAGRRLVVTFDNLSSVSDEDRLPWGLGFLSRKGWDVLGVMSLQKDWFRHVELRAALRGLAGQGFFAGYQAVSMYGASMGAFGALTFAPLSPGCTVMAFAPQSTLAHDLAPFEKRYRWGRSLGDWESGEYRDAAEGVRAAGRAYIAYDPLFGPDARHADRLAGANVVRLPMPGLGHKLPPALSRMGILGQLSEQALTGQLEPEDFHRLFRERRRSPRWCAEVLARSQARGHAKLGLAAARMLAGQGGNWQVRQQLRALKAAAAAAAAGA